MNESVPRVVSLSKQARILALTILIGLGAFLRLHNLGGTCLWIDEITWVGWASPSSSPGRIWNELYTQLHWLHHLPLPPIIEWMFNVLWTHLGIPLTETMYRLPSVGIGIAAIGIMYQLGRDLFSTKVGLAAAFLLSISFFHIFYSREAYDYSALYFCVLLSWHAFGMLLSDLSQRRPTSKRLLVWYALATALVLQMHMSAVFFAFAQFCALVLLPWSAPLRTATNQERVRLLKPLCYAHVVAWIPALPFLWKALHYVSADTSREDSVNLLAILQMVGEMGWSSQPVPLVLFLLLVGWGAWFALKDRHSRLQGILCLLLGLLSTLGIGYFTQRARFETRYFLFLQPMLLLFVAVAWVQIVERTMAKRARVLRVVGESIPWIVLLVWNVPFYVQLYQLKSKLFCGRCVADWIVHNTPPGSAYVLDSAFLRREVPGFYPTPGRYGSAVPMHGSADEYQKYESFLRDLYRRFPDCYFVDVQRKMLQDETFFRHSVRFDNPPLRLLAEAGIFPSAAFYPQLRDPETRDLTTYIRYNTREEILDRKRAAGEAWAVFFGPEWVHSEVPLSEAYLDHFKALHSVGRIFFHGLRVAPRDAEVWIRCGSYGVAQTIEVDINGKVSACELAADRLNWLSLGVMRVEPGSNEITIRKKQPQTSDAIANLLVHEIVLRPTSAQ